MSETLLKPDEYQGGQIGAAGYGVAAIGTQQTSTLTGGVVANPDNYIAGSSVMSGGKRKKRGIKKVKKTIRRYRLGGKRKSGRRSKSGGRSKSGRRNK